MQYRGFIFSVENFDHEDQITLLDHRNGRHYRMKTGRHIYLSELGILLDSLIDNSDIYPVDSAEALPPSLI